MPAGEMADHLNEMLPRTTGSWRCAPAARSPATTTASGGGPPVPSPRAPPRLVGQRASLPVTAVGVAALPRARWLAVVADGLGFPDTDHRGERCRPDHSLNPASAAQPASLARRRRPRSPRGADSPAIDPSITSRSALSSFVMTTLVRWFGGALLAEQTRRGAAPRWFVSVLTLSPSTSTHLGLAAVLPVAEHHHARSRRCELTPSAAISASRWAE